MTCSLARSCFWHFRAQRISGIKHTRSIVKSIGMHVFYYKYFVSVPSAINLLHNKSSLKLQLTHLPMLPPLLLQHPTTTDITFNYTVLCKLNTFVLACNHSDRASKGNGNKISVCYQRGSPKDMGAILSYKRKKQCGKQERSLVPFGE